MSFKKYIVVTKYGYIGNSTFYNIVDAFGFWMDLALLVKYFRLVIWPSDILANLE